MTQFLEIFTSSARNQVSLRFTASYGKNGENGGVRRDWLLAYSQID